METEEKQQISTSKKVITILLLIFIPPIGYILLFKNFKNTKKWVHVILWFYIVIWVCAFISALTNPDTYSNNQPTTASIEETPQGIDTANNISELDITYYDYVRNDMTGNWRHAIFSKNVNIQDYALSYYQTYFKSKDEIHGITNFYNNTTTNLHVSGNILFCDIHEYVKNEEHDAKLMFSGMLLASYQINIDTGEITKENTTIQENTLSANNDTPTTTEISTEPYIEETQPLASKNDATESSVKNRTTYVLNTHTKKFHKPSCPEVKKIKDENLSYYTGSASEMIQQGYSACKKCNP
jgi:uncharacterized membrane protein YqaE (UPF0057 family)